MILENTNGQQILNVTESSETKVFTVTPTVVQTEALFIINADSGTAQIQERIVGETTFRTILDLNLTTNNGTHNNNYALSSGVEYKIVYNLTNGSIKVNKVNQED